MRRSSRRNRSCELQHIYYAIALWRERTPCQRKRSPLATAGSHNFSGRCGMRGDCRSNDAVNSLTGNFVYPVIAAVTGPILTFAPPECFGT